MWKGISTSGETDRSRPPLTPQWHRNPWEGILTHTKLFLIKSWCISVFAVVIEQYIFSYCFVDVGLDKDFGVIFSKGFNQKVKSYCPIKRGRCDHGSRCGIKLGVDRQANLRSSSSFKPPGYLSERCSINCSNEAIKTRGNLTGAEISLEFIGCIGKGFFTLAPL